MTGHDPRPVILRGDARALPLPDSSVDLVVTSPPYFGLRSYTDGGEHYAAQIGAEATPAEFLDALLAVTQECVRVLKPSGSLFVNLGDKYSQRVAARRSSHQDGLFPGRPELAKDWRRDRELGLARMPVENIIDPGTGRHVPEKSLMLIPERYRIRCVDDLGLIARAVLVWSKPNGLPESVTDRVRRSHEDWVHLTKAPRYYSAIDEIREPSSGYERNPAQRATPGGQRGRAMTDTCNPLGKLPGSVWEVPLQPLHVPADVGIDHFAAFPMEWPRRLITGWSPREVCTACGEGRRRVVATVALDLSRPQARRAHELAERAGLTEAHLAALLAVGVSDTGRGQATQTGTGKNTPEVYALAAEARAALGGYAREYLLRRPTSFTDRCACPDTSAPARPGVVLDPFGGTGTTALVAAMLGRTGISVDMSADYCRLARWRCTDPKERARAAGLDPDAVARVTPRDDRQHDLFGMLTDPAVTT